MEKEFIGKEVEVLVSLAGSIVETGITPVVFKGTLLDSDDKFIKMDARESEMAVTSRFGTLFSREENCVVLLKKDYIIYVKVR